MGTADSQDVIRAIAELQRDIKYISKQLENVTEIPEKVVRIEESTKVAHNRIDDTNLTIVRMKEDSKWTWRAIAGGIIAFIIDKLFL